MKVLKAGNFTNSLKDKKNLAYVLGIAGLFSLAGCTGGVPEHERECQWQGTPSWYCRHTSKTDPYFTKGDTQVYFIPAYNNVKEFPVPDMPVYVDESLDQTLRASIVLGDYTAALKKTGLMATVERKGPYTIFAVPNAGMEKPGLPIQGSLMDVQNESTLKRLMGYTIVMGSYTPEYLKSLVLKNHGTVTLTTFYNDPLFVSWDALNQQLIIKNKAGEVNKIWVNGIPQANGVLYVTQGLLNVTP